MLDIYWEIKIKIKSMKSVGKIPGPGKQNQLSIDLNNKRLMPIGIENGTYALQTNNGKIVSAPSDNEYQRSFGTDTASSYIDEDYYPGNGYLEEHPGNNALLTCWWELDGEKAYYQNISEDGMYKNNGNGWAAVPNDNGWEADENAVLDNDDNEGFDESKLRLLEDVVIESNKSTDILKTGTVIRKA